MYRLFYWQAQASLFRLAEHAQNDQGRSNNLKEEAIRLQRPKWRIWFQI